MRDQRTQLVVVPGDLNAQGYVNILKNTQVLFLQAHGPGLTFQHENARPHTAHLKTNFLGRVNILPWPALYPDMNPIKHIWDELG